MRTDEHVILDGNGAVDVRIEPDEDVGADRVFVAHAYDRSGRDAYAPAAQPQQLGAMEVVGFVVGLIAEAGQLREKLVADVDLRHNGFLPEAKMVGFIIAGAAEGDKKKANRVLC